MENFLKQLESEKYISIETMKKNGESVKTPVWFVIRDELIVVITRDQTGKFKRIKNNNKVNIAICSIRGNVSGKLIPGTATILLKEKINDAVKWRDEKYGFISKIAKLLTKNKGQLCAFSIKID